MKKTVFFLALLTFAAVMTGCSSDDSKNVYVRGRGPAVVKPGPHGNPATPAPPARRGRP